MAGVFLLGARSFNVLRPGQESESAIVCVCVCVCVCNLFPHVTSALIPLAIYVDTACKFKGPKTIFPIAFRTHAHARSKCYMYIHVHVDIGILPGERIMSWLFPSSNVYMLCVYTMTIN